MTRRNKTYGQILRRIAYALLLSAALLSFFFGNAWVSLAALLLAVLLPCAFLFFALAQRKNIKITKGEGEEYTFSGLPLPVTVRVNFTAANVFSGEKKEEETTLCFLSSAQTKGERNPRSGYYLQEIHLSVFDLFGLFTFPVKTITSFEEVVYPRLTPLAVTLKGEEGLEQYSFSYRESKEGDERSSFHAYREGEPVRDVHWKLSARFHELILAEKDTPVFFGVALALCSKKEKALEFYFSLSKALLENNIPHSLFFGTQNGVRELSVANEEEFLLAERTILSSPYSPAEVFDGSGFFHLLFVRGESECEEREVVL